MARLLFIIQVYYPDTASVAQQMSDLAEDFCLRGHDVDVLTSRYAYENPCLSYLPLEKHSQVIIRRLWQTRFEKNRPADRVIITQCNK